MLSSLIWFLLIGALAGWLASLLARGYGFGLIGNILLGILGALVGGFVFRLIGIDASYSFWGSLITSTVGALIVLGIAAAFRRP